MKKLELINIQLFSDLDEVIKTNEKAFEGSNIKDQFTAINTKLSELGYDVLINNKKSAEFVPSTRLSEVVGQRDQFKGQVEALNKDLQTLKDAAKGNEALQSQYQGLIDKNNGLLKDLEKANVNMEIVIAAKDAINTKDIFAFINYDNIKLNAKGEVMGVEAEIARIKQEKPYLFTVAGDGKKKGGLDNKDELNKDKNLGGMNAMIRTAAGRKY